VPPPRAVRPGRGGDRQECPPRARTDLPATVVRFAVTGPLAEQDQPLGPKTAAAGWCRFEVPFWEALNARPTTRGLTSPPSG